MQDVSSVGITLLLRASKTFPLGIILTAYPEDGDIGATGNTDIAGNASGVNGDLITWKTVNGIEVNIPIIPNTEDEINLDILFNANRAAKGRLPKKDIIQIVAVNPVTGLTKTYKNGVIKNGSVGYSYGGDGRIKNKTYGFVFEDAI